LSDCDHSFPVSTTGRNYDRSVSVNKYLLVTAVESYIAVEFEANIVCISIKNSHVSVTAKTYAVKNDDYCAVQTTVLLGAVTVISILTSRHRLGNLVKSKFKYIDQIVLPTTTVDNN
jgi:hypothetical protein